MPFKTLRDFKSCSEYVERILTGDRPAFLSRIGGSDTITVATDISNRSSAEAHAAEMAHYRRFVERYNGFYDTEPGSDKAFRAYLDTMIDCYRRSLSLFVGGTDLRIMVYPELEAGKILNNATRRVYEDLLIRMDDGSQKVFLPYEYAETMTVGEHTLANVFSSALEGRKVLVVSPFSETIRSNFHNRQQFFKNYRYPEFELITCNSPITYSGLPRELYPDRNWSETAARLRDEIARLDFDIALLCCGSYAMPLGVAAAEDLGRKAVYLGGVTQLYFGIIGRRYEVPFFTQQINQEYFVRPAESASFLSHVAVEPGSETEAFGAYF